MCALSASPHKGPGGELQRCAFGCEVERLADEQGLHDDPLPSASKLKKEALVVPHDEHTDYLYRDGLYHIDSTGRVSLHGAVPLRRRAGKHQYEEIASTSEHEHHHTQSHAHGHSHEPRQRKPSEPHASASSSERRLELYVEGICCPSEVPIIENVLLPIEGVSEVVVAVPSKTTFVTHDPSLSSAADLVDALNTAGLGAYIKEGGRRSRQRKKRSLPPWNVFASGLLTLVAIVGHITHTEWMKFFGIAAVLVGMPPILVKALGSIRNKVLDINTLMSVAVVGAIVIGEYGEAGAVVALFGLSEWLEALSMSKASDAIEAVLELAPEQATVAATGKVIDAKDIEIGMVLAVMPGDKVPIDGVVVSGASAVDEATLTGESAPVEKAEGSQVFAGTINITSFMTVRASTRSDESAVSRLARLVNEAQARRTKSERAVERFAKYYTPVVVSLALLLASVPYAFGATGTKYVYMACTLLVVSCPCALVLSTPVVTVCALAAAAHRGVVIKGGAHLENLGRMKALATDKTGTLTTGHFGVTRVAAALSAADMRRATASCLHGGSAVAASSSSAEPLLLEVAARVERQSPHPLAKAVVAEASLRGAWPPPEGADEATDFAIIPGEGISATLGASTVHVGSGTLARRLGWLVQPAVAAAGLEALEEDLQRHGATVSWVAVDGVVLGVFACADTVRLGAADAVRALQSRGVRVMMLTGDNAGAAGAVADKVGLTARDVHAGLTPEDKLDRVEDLKLELQRAVPRRGWFKRAPGALAMVGDGVNDGPALAAADVGIAMGVAGTAVAMETADVSLFTNDLRVLAEVQQLGTRAVGKVVQNIIFSCVFKGVVVLTSLLGVTGLWVAIVADLGSALVVIGNGMTLLNNRHSRKVLARHRQEASCAAAAAAASGASDCCASGACKSKTAPTAPESHCCTSGACNSAGAASASGERDRLLLNIGDDSSCCEGNGCVTCEPDVGAGDVDIETGSQGSLVDYDSDDLYGP